MVIGFKVNASEFEVAFSLRSLLTLSARIYVSIPEVFNLFINRDSLPASLYIVREGHEFQARIGHTQIEFGLPFLKHTRLMLA